MQEIERDIKIKLPLTIAEKSCLSRLISVCPKACNYVSKYIYKHKISSQTQTLEFCRTVLEEDYNLSYNTVKAVVRTVTTKYKEREKQGQKRKRLRFTKKDCFFYYKVNYYISDKQFYIDILNTKVELTPIDYEKYFGVFDKVSFGPATIERTLFETFLHIPITIHTQELTKVEEVFADVGIAILWAPIKRRFIKR